MHRALVEERRWISERRFLHALSYCMVLPGPEAQQLATYIGWLLHRTWGGLIAGGLFVLPSLVHPRRAVLDLRRVRDAAGGGRRLRRRQAGGGRDHRAGGASPRHPRPEDAGRLGDRRRCRSSRWWWRCRSRSSSRSRRSPACVIARLAPGQLRHGPAHGAGSAPAAPAVIDDDTPTPPHARFRVARLARVVGVGLALVGGAAGPARVAAGRGDAGAHGLVLHQGRAPHLRRRLRRAALRRAGRGARAPLADRGADDRRAGARRDDAGAADHGGDLRRLRRRLRPGAVRPRPRLAGRPRRGRRRHLVHVPAVVRVRARRRTASSSRRATTSPTSRRSPRSPPPWSA